MPKFKNYSAALVERQLKAIARRNPDSINPQNGDDCLYHQGRGRNIRRCLIGQWGFEQGFKTPNPINGGVAEVIETLWFKQANFTEEAVLTMQEMQNRADGWDDNGDSNPISWGDLIV